MHHRSSKMRLVACPGLVLQPAAADSDSFEDERTAIARFCLDEPRMEQETRVTDSNIYYIILPYMLTFVVRKMSLLISLINRFIPLLLLSCST